MGYKYNECPWLASWAFSKKYILIDMNSEYLSTENPKPIIMTEDELRAAFGTTINLQTISRLPERKAKPKYHLLEVNKGKIYRINHYFCSDGKYDRTELFYSKMMFDGRWERIDIFDPDLDKSRFVLRLRKGIQEHGAEDHIITSFQHSHQIHCFRYPSEKEKARKKHKHVTRKKESASGIKDKHLYIRLETGHPQENKDKFSVKKVTYSNDVLPQNKHWTQRQNKPACYVNGIDTTFRIRKEGEPIPDGYKTYIPLHSNTLRIFINRKNVWNKMTELMEKANADNKKAFDRFIDIWATYTIALIYINWSWNDEEWIDTIGHKEILQWALYFITVVRPHNIEEADKYWLIHQSMDFVYHKIQKRIANKLWNGIMKAIKGKAKGNRICYPNGFTKEQQKVFKEKRMITRQKHKHSLCFVEKHSKLIDTIHNLHEQGMTYKTISIQLNVSYKTVLINKH